MSGHANERRTAELPDAASTRQPRYDGLADWYDETFAGYGRGSGSSADHLERLLGPGTGRCLDIGCGTGLHFSAMQATGREVVGLDLSADQLRIAARRTQLLVRGHATQLPFPNAAFDDVVATYLHTDIDDMAPVFAEAARVLRPLGRLVYVGVHPCFVGFFVERLADGTRLLHPGYANGGWHFASPYFGPGIRGRVGERHVPLGALLSALLTSGLRLVVFEELPSLDVVPWSIGLVAEKA